MIISVPAAVASGRPLQAVVILSLISFAYAQQTHVRPQDTNNAANQVQNKTKRWTDSSETTKTSLDTQYPTSEVYQQVSFDDDSRRGSRSIEGHPASLKPKISVAQPLILLSPTVLEEQEAKVRHVFLKPSPSPSPSAHPTPKVAQKAKVYRPASISHQDKKLEAQPQFHSYSTFILPPQLQTAVVPTQYPIKHAPTAYYGYATVPTSTPGPLLAQKSLIKHVYLDQKHPVLHYHYQTYPNSKPLVIHNSIPQNAPLAGPHPPPKEVKEEVKEDEREGEDNREAVEDEESEEEVEDHENERNENDEDEEEEEEKPAKHRLAYHDEEDEDEKESLEEEDEEEDDDKGSLEEGDNRRNYGPQVFYPQSYTNSNEEEDDEEEAEEPERKKEYRNEQSEESEDEDEEESKGKVVTVPPNYGNAAYKRLADEYKNIQYPKPIRFQVVKKTHGPTKHIYLKPNAGPYPNSLKASQSRAQSQVQSGQQTPKVNFSFRLPKPEYPNDVRARQELEGDSRAREGPQNHQQQPAVYQRLRSYFTAAPQAKILVKA